MRLHALVLLAFLLVPTGVLAEPEILLTIGAAPAASDSGPFLGDPFAHDPDAVTLPVHEGDVVPLPACDAALDIGLRPSPDAPARQRIVVRLMKRQVSGGTCEIEVLTITPRPTSAMPPKGSQTVGLAARTGTDTPPTSDAGPRGDSALMAARRLPCGTEVIEIRNGGSGGSINHLHGLGPSGTCTDNVIGGALAVHRLAPGLSGEGLP